MVLGRITRGRHTDNPGGHHPRGLISNPPPSIPPIFMPDALPAATLPIYLGTGTGICSIADLWLGFTTVSFIISNSCWVWSTVFMYVQKFIFVYFITLPAWTVQNVAMFMCLWFLYLKKAQHPNFAKFFVHVTCDHGWVLLQWQCSRLCTWVLWTTSCFHIVDQTRVPAIDELFSVTDQVAALAVCNVANCSLWVAQ